MTRVVVTGIGLLSSHGFELSDHWENLSKQVKKFSPIPERWKEFNSYRSNCYVKAPSANASDLRIPKGSEIVFDQATVNYIYAVEQALKDAKLLAESPKDRTLGPFSKDDVGVYVGSSGGGLNSLFEGCSAHLSANMESKPATDRFNPFNCMRFMPGATANAISTVFGALGECKAHSYACASSSLSLKEAFEAVSGGKIKAAICGGSEFLNDEFGGIHKSFDICGLLAKEETCDPQSVPLDRSANGLIFSEGGAATLILESHESAVNRGADIYAELLSVESDFDGYHAFKPDPEGAGWKKITDKCLNDNALSPEDIDYVSANGNGSASSDEIEARLISEKFPNAIVNSMKSIMGHTFGVSGALDYVINMLQYKNGQVIGNDRSKEPLSGISIPKETVPHNHKITFNYNSGLGGHTVLAVFKNI